MEIDNKSYASFLAFDNTSNGNNRVERTNYQKKILPRVHITSCSVLLNGRNAFDESINNPVKKYNEIRKVS